MRAFRLSDSAPEPRRDGHDVADEIRLHLDLRTEELIAQGLAPDEARRAAVAAFGDVSGIEAECRALREERARARRRRLWRWDLAADVRYALRTFRHAPLFTVAAVLTLALGMGGALAAFTLVDGVLLRPMPYADPSRLAMVWTRGDGLRGAELQWPLSAPNYLDVKAESRSFTGVAAFRSWPYTLAGASPDADAAEMLAGSRVAPELFAVLGVRPLLGRALAADDARDGSAPVAVIGWDLWRRRFGGSPDVIGRQVTLSGQRVTIVGVMPRGFAFPRGAELPGGLQFAPRTEVWTPLIFTAEQLARRGTNNLAAVARLRDGVSLDRAQADLRRIATRLAAEYPRWFDPSMSLYAVELQEQAAAPVRRGLLLLLGAVGLVLLIACANIANLLLARASGREREFAVRRALGATRGRVLRQLAVENVLLAFGGAAVALAAAAAATRLLVAHAPAGLPRADDVSVDARIVAVTLALALVVGLVFAAVTALHARGATDVAGTRGARATGGLAQRAGRRSLAGAEVALSLVLLVGAGLLFRSYVRLQGVEPGFAADRAMTAGLLMPIGSRFDPARDGARWSAAFLAYAERLSALPGVEAAGGVSSLPLSGAIETAGFRIEGRDGRPGEEVVEADYAVVTPRWFAAMGIPLVAGRAPDARDGPAAPRVIVVNGAFARRYWPGEPMDAALGRRILFGTPSRVHRVVGVVADVRHASLSEPPAPAMYFPVTQMPYPFLTFVVRTRPGTGSPATALPAMQRALHALDPGLALHEARPLAEVVRASVARQRFGMLVTGGFAATALVLATVGVYSVIAYGVAQRTREIGVRVALGATQRDVLSVVMREALWVTGAGLAVGLAGAVAGARLLQDQLYEVSASDGTVYVVVLALTATVALAASAVPARRAVRLDPTTSLRAE